MGFMSSKSSLKSAMVLALCQVDWFFAINACDLLRLPREVENVLDVS